MTRAFNPIPLCAKPECPSELTLERLIAGELAYETKTEVERSVASCASCQARLRALQQGFDAFPALDAQGVLARIESKRETKPTTTFAKWMAWLSGRQGLALGLVTAVVLLIALRAPNTGEPSSSELAGGVRAKGGLTLRVHRQQGAGSELMLSGDTFRAGDRIRFEVDTPADGHLMIVGVESSGSRYVAWPIGSIKSVPVKAGPRRLLPGAVELDAAQGKESLNLVLCPSAFELLACTDDRGTLSCGPGCMLTVFSVDKQP